MNTSVSKFVEKPGLDMVKQSVVFFLYLGLISILCLGVVQASGDKNIVSLGSYVVALILSFIVFSGLLYKLGNFSAKSSIGLNAQTLSRLARGLLGATIGFIAIHFLWLGKVPVISGAMINDYYDVMRVRQAIFFEAPALFRYLPNLALKSVLPFLILYFYITGRTREFWITTLVAVLYGAALMNKMFIVIPVVPIILFLAMQRKFLLIGKVLVLPVALLAILVFVQNPHTRPEFWTPPEKATASGKPLLIERTVLPTTSRIFTLSSFGEKSEAATSSFNVWDYIPVKFINKVAFPALQFVETIYLRTIVIPGQVITAWFKNIPEQLPFAHGCGYRWFATMAGCEFKFFPQLIHDIENPVLVSEGIKGTMTAANFMEDYANFGKPGLIGSGIVSGLLLVVIGWIYKNNWRTAILLNLLPIAMLIELPLSTVLVTGGWAFTTFLYFLFRPVMNELEMPRAS